MSPKLALFLVGLAVAAIDVNRTHAPVDSVQTTRMWHRTILLTMTMHVRQLFERMSTLTPTDLVLSNQLRHVFVCNFLGDMISNFV
jgi:hypothetical protein